MFSRTVTLKKKGFSRVQALIRFDRDENGEKEFVKFTFYLQQDDRIFIYNMKLGITADASIPTQAVAQLTIMDYPISTLQSIVDNIDA